MTLNDICELIVDCPHSTAKDEGAGYPLIRTPNIGRGRLMLDDVHRVSKVVYDKRNARAIPQDDDLILAREAPAGNVAIIKNGEQVCLGQRTVLIRPDKSKVYPDFLAYYILAPQQQYELLGTANGATVAHVNIPVIKALPVELPAIEVQQKAADILKSYDDLIENNQKQIKLLEEAAQRLYKEWFVDLRFPGYEKTEIIDGVPAGWKKEKLVKIADIKAGGDKPEEYSNNKTRENSIPIYANGTEKEGLFGYTNKPVITDESVTISARGTVGCVFLRRTPYVPIVRLLSVIPYEVSAVYLYYCLSNEQFERNGTSQQQITVPMVKDKLILIADKETVRLFVQKVIGNINKKDVLTEQCKLLKEARDRLLPKLMNGEIEI